jgi:hypothetical protein
MFSETLNLHRVMLVPSSFLETVTTVDSLTSSSNLLCRVFLQQHCSFLRNEKVTPFRFLSSFNFSHFTHSPPHTQSLTLSRQFSLSIFLTIFKQLSHCLILTLSVSPSQSHPLILTLTFSPSHSHSLSLTLSVSLSHSHSLSLTLSVSPSHSYSQILTLSFSLSQSHSLILTLSFSLSHSHSLILTLSFSLSHSHSHILTLSFSLSHCQSHFYCLFTPLSVFLWTTCMPLFKPQCTYTECTYVSR